MFTFTRPEATLNGKHYPEQKMIIGSTNFIEANETDDAVWVKVWVPEEGKTRSYKAKESMKELVEMNM